MSSRTEITQPHIESETKMVGSRLQRAIAATTTLVTAAAILAGCTAQPPAVARPSSAAAVASNDDPADSMTPDAGSSCGQVSALAGIAMRAELDIQSGSIDENAYRSTMAMLADAWQYLTIEPGALTTAVGGVALLAAAHPQEFDTRSTDVADAIRNVQAACESTGQTIFISARPGQGG